jgi:hypothetical protein
MSSGLRLVAAGFSDVEVYDENLDDKMQRDKRLEDNIVGLTEYVLIMLGPCGRLGNTSIHSRFIKIHTRTRPELLKSQARYP